MKGARKAAPKFASETDERAFWESHDSADYVDLSKARRAVYPNLKPTTTAISLRLPVSLLEASPPTSVTFPINR